MMLDWLTLHRSASACEERFTTSPGASRMARAIARSLAGMLSSRAFSVAISPVLAAAAMVHPLSGLE